MDVQKFVSAVAVNIILSKQKQLVGIISQKDLLVDLASFIEGNINQKVSKNEVIELIAVASDLDPYFYDALLDHLDVPDDGLDVYIENNLSVILNKILVFVNIVITECSENISDLQNDLVGVYGDPGGKTEVEESVH